ncbi:FKBP12-associated protein [Mortierella sp. GBA43]|nr:FKBP12-associated protein [Mortierella sp. GBA43]
MVMDGDAQDVKTPKFLFLKNIAVTAARSTSQSSTDTSHHTHAESSVDVPEIALTHVTSRVTQAHVLHAAVLVLFNLAITFQLRCSDTDYSSNTGKSCDQVCGELLGCRKHTCNSVCHPDLCPPCEEEEIQKCYCGKHERKARCGEGIPKATLVNDAEELGFFDCHDICRRYGILS